MHRLIATPEDLYAGMSRVELLRDDEGGTHAARLAELADQAALIAGHVARLRERPLFARDDISDRQADELETRLRNLRQSMASIQPATGAA